MNLYICEICGDAYIGSEKPSDCPFCGSRNNFIKSADSAEPIINQKKEISEISRKNLTATLELEMHANAIYACMAGKSSDFRVQKMYKRLAKVELEHAIVSTKLLGIAMPPSANDACADTDRENFSRTIELEDSAAFLYRKFLEQAQEEHIRKYFAALIQVEEGHSALIKKFQ